MACAPKLAPAFAGCTAPSAASPAEPAVKPDVIVWYILASLHRRQREPTAPDVLVWYVLTPVQSRQRLQTKDGPSIPDSDAVARRDLG